MHPAASTHENISPTAKLVAYWRQFTDIPYSQDIASYFHVEETMQEMFADQLAAYKFGVDTVFAPYIEIRYKSIQYAILKREIKQVLEFASGISLRGLAMTCDPELVYVETDLPGITEEKCQVVQKIMTKHNIPDRDNLFFYPVNILQFSEIEPVLRHFDAQQPIAIVNEGLLQYLSLEEKKVAAQHIHRILSQFGGIWITPDLDTQVDMQATAFQQEETQYQSCMDAITKTTGCNLLQNAFENDAAVLRFFTEMGFTVQIQSQFDDDLVLSSLKGKSISQTATDSIHNLRLWVMTVAKRPVE